MADYEGPERTDRTDESVVQVTAWGMSREGHGSFTVYLEPGETMALADDDPNRVEVTALQ